MSTNNRCRCFTIANVSIFSAIVGGGDAKKAAAGSSGPPKSVSEVFDKITLVANDEMIAKVRKNYFHANMNEFLNFMLIL